MPNSFGIVVPLDPNASAGENALTKVLTLGGVLGSGSSSGGLDAGKSRTYIFSTMSRDDFDDWTKVVQMVVAEKRAMELHWFEKMAQGIF
jgi:hypothetical protein